MEEKDYIASFLKEIIGLPGISGHETPVSSAIARHWQPLTDEIQRTAVGNLYGIRHGKAHKNGKKARKVIMAVHMDGIGMLVERFSGDMLYFAPVGGFDPRILPGQQVTIHGQNGDLPGVIVQLAPHLLSKPYDDKPLPLDELVIDTGLDEEALRAAVRVGDTISYATVPTDMPTDCISGHSLDNRASVAAVTQCLMELQRFEHEWDVYAVGTTQEETTYLSHTVVEDIQPDIAIVIDVTFAKGPGADGWQTKPLASGPSIGFGANLHPVLFRSLTQLCDQLGITYTKDPLPGMSGTDAVSIQVARGGVATCLLGIPLRYMHTPVEIISLKDVMAVGHLMAEFIARLDAKTMDQLVWED